VERTNRKLRYDEKVRYKFRSQRSLDHFLRLRLALLVRQTSGAEPSAAGTVPGPDAAPNGARIRV
jgi:hypothetical protein